MIDESIIEMKGTAMEIPEYVTAKEVKRVCKALGLRD
jgi:hypothetical protein